MKIFKGLLSLTTLNQAIDYAIEGEHLYIGFLTETYGLNAPELVIYQSPDFETIRFNKSLVYDEKLRFKFDPDSSRISGIMVADRLSDFRYLLKKE